MESRFDQPELVIKVKHGDSLKRFTASIYKNTLDHKISTLKSKIISAFNFPPNTDFILTYIDTDDDTVMLANDEDLTDAAVKQRLNPLRITVQLKSNGSPSSASEPKSQSPNLNIPLDGLSSSLEEALKSIPGPLNETILKVTEDIISKATLGPVLAELLNVFSKLTVPETPPRPPVNNNEPKASSVEPSKETKKGVQSDKPESSNARGGYNCHQNKGGYFPNPPFVRTPPPPFIPPPFSPIYNRRNYESPKFSPMGSYTNNGNNVLPYPTGFFPTGHPYMKGDEFQGVHRGIVCDGCDVTPIVGPRFKSTVKEDYDLCSACFSRMGNEADYARIDRPDFHGVFRDFSHLRYNNNNNNGPSWGGCPMMRSKRSSKLESRFIQDVTVSDGTLMAPLAPFTKIWRMRNNGSTVWPFGTQLVWVGGDQFSSQISAQLEVPVNGFPMNEEIDIAVDFCAPSRAGRYISYWRLALPSGQKFGQRVWVLIQVEQPNNTEKNIKSAINLNLPPESNMPDAIEMVDINVEPSIETDSKPTDQTNITYPVVDAPFPQAEPVVTEPVPAVTQSIPIIVTQPEPVMVYDAPLSPLGSYPLIDLSPSPSYVPLVDLVQVEDKSQTEEETLLKELEEMGFKQLDLNKEVLRLNKNDLEKSVEDLCGFSEWDPLLEELKEMGFDDKEMNKKLLMKNGGSIKRVVMDLVAGEKME